MKNFCIIIPRVDDTGPVKGAIATAIEMAKTDNVTVIALFKSRRTNKRELCDLDAAGVSLIRYNLTLRLFILAAIKLRLDKVNSRFDGVLSFLLPADVVLYISRIEKCVVTSIRQDMYDNYRFDFSPFGQFVSWLHFHVIKKRVCVVLNQRIKRQLTGRAHSVVLLPNFIISKPRNLGRYSFSDGIRCVYVGSLTERKQPKVAVNQFIRIKSQFPSATLDIFGEGPLKDDVYKLIEVHKLQECVHLRGFADDIGDRFPTYHFMICPSQSEGVSRAAMEALDKGVFLLASDIPGMAELTRLGGGAASNNTSDLLNQIKTVVERFEGKKRSSLLPPEYYAGYVVPRLRSLLVNAMSEPGNIARHRWL